VSERFEVIILIGRPAAGKSEVIDFLKRTDAVTRERRFHIGPFVELDDFPYVWETFEIDDLLERLGQPRVFTTPDYFFTGEHLWNLFIERLGLEFRKFLARDAKFTERQTVLVEFSRGGERGFAEAFAHLSDEILGRAGIVYINVSYAESVRKNKLRFDPAQADSILYHSLPDAKMERYYKTNDWEKIAARNPDFIEVKGFKIPYGVFENEPEKTLDPVLIGKELERVTQKIWKLRE